MKILKPPHRLVELGLVLQFDSYLQDNGFTPLLTTFERMFINKERSNLLNNEFYYQLPSELDKKIELILTHIHNQNWKPENLIQYNKTEK